MKKYISFGLGLLALAYVVLSFLDESNGAPKILGFAVNVWFYRLFWALLGCTMLYSFYKENKNAQES